MLQEQDVDEVLQAVAAGSLEALKALYETYNRRVYGLAYAICKDFELAEDVVQDTFLTVFEKAGGYRPCGKGEKWILGIAKNLTRQHLRRERRYCLAEPDENRPCPRRFEDRLEENWQLRELLQSLNPKEQDIVVLHTLGELKLKDIAGYLDMPLGSVYWSYNNALRKMRRQYSVQTGEPTGQRY